MNNEHRFCFYFQKYRAPYHAKAMVCMRMVVAFASLGGKESTVEHLLINAWIKHAVEMVFVIQTESVNAKKGSKEKLVKKVRKSLNSE